MWRKEQTMSKDIIYREEAIKAINLRMRIPHDVVSAQYASMAINAICSVPSADRPQEWIPCSERVPKPYVEVLVCDDYGWINLGAYRPCDISEDCSGWSIHAHTKIGTEEVVAWMPLPKPWKGADDEID